MNEWQALVHTSLLFQVEKLFHRFAPDLPHPVRGPAFLGDRDVCRNFPFLHDSVAKGVGHRIYSMDEDTGSGSVFDVDIPLRQGDPDLQLQQETEWNLQQETSKSTDLLWKACLTDDCQHSCYGNLPAGIAVFILEIENG